MEDPKIIQDQARESMEAAIMFLDDTLAHIRAGKASVRVLDPIRIDYYGQMSPLSAVATITTPDARSIAIQPWDRKMIGDIERAIINSNIGFAPSNNGEIIRLTFPPLTEERRREIVKDVKKLGEESKVAIRNIRRDMVDKLKKIEKDENLPEDAVKDNQDKIQKVTDKYTDNIDKAVADKEKEVMTV